MDLMACKTTDFSPLRNDFTPGLMDSSASLNLRELPRFARTLIYDPSSSSTVWALHNKCKGMWLESKAAAISFSMWRFFSTLSVIMIVDFFHNSFTVILCFSFLPLTRRVNRMSPITNWKSECVFHIQNHWM